MEKIFIDLGYNIGQSTSFFHKLVPDSNEYKIHAFEPDSRNNSKFDYSLPINYYKQAAWVYDGVIKFYLGSLSFASTINSTKTTNVNTDNYTEVECIDLSNFIINNFNKQDYIILKVDIEGAEYQLLEHLITTQAIEYIDDLFVEFHLGKIKDVNEKQHNELITKLYSLGFKYANIAWEEENITLKMIKLYENA